MSGDLSALVARLEAVTARLESAADKASGGAPEGMIESLRTEGSLGSIYLTLRHFPLTYSNLRAYLFIYLYCWNCRCWSVGCSLRRGIIRRFVKCDKVSWRSLPS